MKEMKLPEEQLSSWQPRRPSAGLKRRIFAHAGKSYSSATRWLVGTLTPTMACLALTLSMLNSSNSAAPQKSAPTLFLSNQNSNQDNLFSHTDGSQTVQNHLDTVTFYWTNPLVFNSSMRFTPTTNLSN